ncbi:hypothetical protein PTKIN_Ptkin06aG0165800 [Pterospermum kingtungense]
MPGFYLRHFLRRHRSQLSQGRRRRAIRASIARKRRVNRCELQSLIVAQTAAADMEMEIRRIRERNMNIFAVNSLIDQYLYDILLEVGNDP